jgi:hypothetical protein
MSGRRATVARCKDCDWNVIRLVDQWHEVVGYTKVRKKGGVNQVALASPTGAILCDQCMGKRKRGLQGQEGLFDGLESDV